MSGEEEREKKRRRRERKRRENKEHRRRRRRRERETEREMKAVGSVSFRNPMVCGGMRASRVRVSHQSNARLVGGVRQRQNKNTIVAHALPTLLLFDCDGVLVETERYGPLSSSLVPRPLSPLFFLKRWFF